MPKKRGFFEKICCCFCDDTGDSGQNIQQRPQQQQQQQQAQHAQPMPPPQMNPVKEEMINLGVKREFNLSLSQISGKEDRINEEDFNKYKYSCPICLMYFNRILKMKCCNNYVCYECEYDIHQQMLNKKIESKCWWCKSENCEIIDVQDGEQIKNYSDAAQELEDHKKKQLEVIQSMVRESKIQRQSMMRTFKSQQVDDRYNNNNPLHTKTVQSYNVDNISHNLGTLNRNQWNNFNPNQQLVEEDEEEEKHIDRDGIHQKQFSKTDNFQGMSKTSKLQHLSLNSPNNQSKIQNSSLCFNVQGQALPMKLINNSLEQQYRKIDSQQQYKPGGYFFNNNQQNQLNQEQQNQNYENQKFNYFHNQQPKQNEQIYDPYKGGPNNHNRGNQNKIIEKDLSSEEEINQRESEIKNNFNVPQQQKNYKNQVIVYNEENDSDINDRA